MKSICSHNREERVFPVYEVPPRPGSQKVNKIWAWSSGAQNNGWHIGQRGADLPGNHAFLHVFPEHLLCARSWGCWENTIGPGSKDFPVVRKKIAVGHTIIKVSDVTCASGKYAQTAAQRDLPGCCLRPRGQGRPLEERRLSRDCRVCAWAGYLPLAASPFHPSALPPVPERM